MDYGCIVYSSARKTLIATLNIIQNAAIRYCLGAFPTSPVTSLYCEAGVPPLETLHPNNSIFHVDMQAYRALPTITRPACVRFQEMLGQMDMVLPTLLDNRMSDAVPWIIPARV